MPRTGSPRSNFLIVRVSQSALTANLRAIASSIVRFGFM